MQASAELAADLLTIKCDDSDSARLVIAWQLEGIGEVTISTSTLAQRHEPYQLPVELARGTLNRLRNQLSEWSMMGLVVSDSVTSTMNRGVELFAHAAIQQGAPHAFAGLCDEAIALGYRASAELAHVYANFRPKEQTLWNACEIETQCSEHVLEELDSEDLGAVLVPASWNRIECNQNEFDWQPLDRLVSTCTHRRLRSFVGPLIDFSHDAIPDWLLLWQNDFEAIESFVRRFLGRLASRYRGKVHLWNCCAVINAETDFGFNEEQRLRLSVATIESIREFDSATPLIVTVDQPWGEYLIRETLDLTPLQFADMLARADIGISGFGLKLHIGTNLSRTLLRDPLEINRLIDTWSLFGKPLVLFLDVESEQDLPAIEKLLPLLRAKQFLQGIVWGDRLRSIWAK